MTTLIAFPPGVRPPATTRTYSDSEDVTKSQHGQVIYRVIERLRKQGKTDQNVLTIGFGMMSDDPNSRISSLPHVEYSFPNSNFSQLHLPVWRRLLSRVGEPLMTFILESASLYMFLPPSSYAQITGFPAFNLPGGEQGKFTTWHNDVPGPVQTTSSQAKSSTSATHSVKRQSPFPTSDRNKVSRSDRKPLNETSRAGQRLKRPRTDSEDDRILIPATKKLKTVTGSDLGMDLSIRSEDFVTSTQLSQGKTGGSQQEVKEADATCICETRMSSSERNKTPQHAAPNKPKGKRKTRRGKKKKAPMRGSDGPLKPVFNSHQFLSLSRVLYGKDLREKWPANYCLSWKEEIGEGVTRLFLAIFKDVIKMSVGRADPSQHSAKNTQPQATQSEGIARTATSQSERSKTTIPDSMNMDKDSDINDNDRCRERREAPQDEAVKFCENISVRTENQTVSVLCEASNISTSTNVTNPYRHSDKVSFSSDSSRRSVQNSANETDVISNEKKRKLNVFPTRPLSKLGDTPLHFSPENGSGRNNEGTQRRGVQEKSDSSIENNSHTKSSGNRGDTKSSDTSTGSKSGYHKSFFGLGNSTENEELQDLFEKFGMFFGKKSHMFGKSSDQPCHSDVAPSGVETSRKGSEVRETVNVEDRLSHCVNLLPVYHRVQPYLQQFMENHRKFRYQAFLKQYCPAQSKQKQTHMSKKTSVHNRPPTPRLKSVVFKRRGSTTTKSLVHNTGAKCSIFASPAQRRVKRGGRSSSQLLEDNVPKRQIFLFLRQVLLRVFPREIIGVRNWNQLLKHVKCLLSLGRYDKLSLGELCAGIKVSCIPWLSEVSNHSTRLSLVSALLWWLFTGFLMVILKTYFYVTDTTHFRNKVFFYRKSVWHQLKERARKDYLSKGILKPISLQFVSTELRSGISLGVSPLRFLPKTQTLRPIINMGTRAGTAGIPNIGNCPPVNIQLQDGFRILSYEKNRRPELMGCSVFGVDAIYTKWQHFVTRRMQNNDDRALYFVTVDIRNCYDSINQGKLFSIVSDMLQQSGVEEYVIRRYVKLVRTDGDLRKIFCHSVSSLEEFQPNFLRFLTQRPEGKSCSDALLVDQILQQHVSVADVLRKLRAHLHHNIIRLGGKYYQQCEGISQGSVLSSLLCGLYYGHLESRVVSPGQDEVLMRMVDDWLYVTPYMDKAVHFLTTMTAGIPEYNCYTNLGKTLTNFTSPSWNGAHIDGQNELFPWCGLLFDTHSLSVRIDYSRYQGLSISDTVTSDNSHHPGVSLRRKLMFALRTRSHALYVDSQFNSLEVIVSNIYKIFLLLAFKFHAAVRRLPLKQRANQNAAFFLGIISDSSVFFYNQTTLKMKKLCGNVNWSVSLKCIKWLCVDAFLQKVANHHSEYHLLLKSLKQQRCSIRSRMTKEDKAVCGLMNKGNNTYPSEFLMMLT